ncbi:MAG TPA: hypothetical protein DDW52_17880 [Planctomycetaceae bacterium]|nr:hypothetical protein [Planctomycetaceae bacterium]
MRVDSAHHKLQYPPAPDSRGSARVVLDRKTYYFGRHNSPESYAMFGAWLAHYERTGTTYKPSVIREAASNFVGVEVPEDTERRWTLPIASGIAVIFAGAFIFNVWFSSSSPDSHVDGIAMTATEVEYVRSLRDVASETLSRQSKKADRVAEIMDQISREGLPDAPPPRISAKPPISEVK